MKTRLLAILVIAVALGALADPPGKYKDWANSPQGYFMTKAERAQWAAIKTDIDAEQFVTKFLASRGPDFPALVADRVAAADKYLTYGKTPGSQTLRGKVIVLLGPPTSFGVSERTAKRSGEGTSGGAVEMAAGGAGLDEMSKSAARGDMSANLFRVYDIGYTAEKMPAGFGKPLALAVELDTTTGHERITDRKAEAALDNALEMAREGSIKAAR